MFLKTFEAQNLQCSNRFLIHIWPALSSLLVWSEPERTCRLKILLNLQGDKTLLFYITTCSFSLANPQAKDNFFFSPTSGKALRIWESCLSPVFSEVVFTILYWTQGVDQYAFFQGPILMPSISKMTKPGDFSVSNLFHFILHTLHFCYL